MQLVNLWHVLSIPITRKSMKRISLRLAKTLEYHVEVENTTKVLRNMLRKMDRKTILKRSSCMEGFYSTVERGVEVLREMNDEEFEDLLEP